LSIFFGENNYIVFQLLNVAALVLIYKELSEIAACIGINKRCQLAILFFGIFFLPLTLYTTFVYGTLISLALALSALSYDSEGKFCIKKFDGSDRQKWRLIAKECF